MPMEPVSSRCATSRSATRIPTWKTSPHSKLGTPAPERSIIGLPPGGRRGELMPPVGASGDLVRRLLALHAEPAEPELDRVPLRRVDVEGHHLVVGVPAQGVH